MDAFDRRPIGDLKDKLAEISSGSGAPVFDIGNEDFKNNGFTRHYLFDINGSVRVMRICLTSELGLQPEIPEKDIITRGKIESVKATYQVFDLGALSEVQKPKPRVTFHSREVDRSS